MEKRHSERVPYHLKAKIVSADKTYDGFIENVSEQGCGYLITSLIRAPEDFAPEKMMKLVFSDPSGKTVHLNCEAVWHLKTSLDYKNLFIGMKIITPSQDYNDLIKNGKYWYL